MTHPDEIVMIPMRAATLEILGRHLANSPYKITRLIMPEIEAAIEQHNALKKMQQEAASELAETGD